MPYVRTGQWVRNLAKVVSFMKRPLSELQKNIPCDSSGTIPKHETFLLNTSTSGQRQPITFAFQARFLGRFRIRAVTQSLRSWTAQ